MYLNIIHAFIFILTSIYIFMFLIYIYMLILILILEKLFIESFKLWFPNILLYFINYSLINNNNMR
jgi:hypothetical protein